MANRKKEPRATAAWYDGTTRRVVVELGTGYRVGIPLARMKEIAAATSKGSRAGRVGAQQLLDKPVDVGRTRV